MLFVITGQWFSWSLWKKLKQDANKKTSYLQLTFRKGVSSNSLKISSQIEEAPMLDITSWRLHQYLQMDTNLGDTWISEPKVIKILYGLII